jgi:hypothetical protein
MDSGQEHDGFQMMQTVLRVRFGPKRRITSLSRLKAGRQAPKILLNRSERRGV